MSQAVKCDLFLYADDSFLVCQHNHINEIQTHLNEVSSNIWDWFVDNKLSIQLGEDKKNHYFFLRNLKEKNSKKTGHKIWAYTNQATY